MKLLRQIPITLLAFLFSEDEVYSQKQVTHTNQVWLGYYNQTRFSGKWGIWTDIHLRTKEDFLSNFSQSIFRAGITYYLNTDTKLTAGYAYVSIYPGDNHPLVTRPEHRPWQQIQWHTNYSRIRMMQYVRLEERFRRKIKNPDELGEGYNFNYRVRYNITLLAALGKKPFKPNTFSFMVNDELHLNAGREIIYNTFDQNRFYIGFNYHISNTQHLQFGYLNQFIQSAAGNQYKMAHGARINYLHNLDFRKK